ncbi:riboflavin synthase [Pseudobacteroides cellulosolvens]|uniref:Riboflavin synthase n=1 Tax=Pseudobacteroides cellulosolvens ATCC 35603 = DSM 2933 TaxID=398512 RepID=A0A0L6JST5_9FIRM|nr:riboflavin synthase [Pseudobacteroides cellulosolvens]KNY28487.1 riboflavin synthase, alpha subunit [Pseudobacteroides cellulosolvens ATCC 35603 = DSM 2933]
MFTGIVEELGKVKSISYGSKSIKLIINCNKVIEGTRVGDSIAVNGVCLTVTDMGNEFFIADVMPETLRKTSLNDLAVSSFVNLERALKLSDRLGGHLVSGHIDGTGIISEKEEEDNAAWYSIKADEEILKYIILKGSVAIDGTSLTVAYVDDGIFKVSLIPHTREVTILGTKKAGDTVNIEVDQIAKYVEKLTLFNNKDQDNKSRLSMDFLRDNGFL